MVLQQYIVSSEPVMTPQRYPPAKRKEDSLSTSSQTTEEVLQQYDTAVGWQPPTHHRFSSGIGTPWIPVTHWKADDRWCYSDYCYQYDQGFIWQSFNCASFRAYRHCYMDMVNRARGLLILLCDLGWTLLNVRVAERERDNSRHGVQKMGWWKNGYVYEYRYTRVCNRPFS